MARKNPTTAGVELTIRTGDWVGKLAVTYGHLAWETSVWSHARNQALREKRQDPHLLSPGDKLFIPPREEKESAAASGAKHRFRLQRPRECLRVRLLQGNSEPLADAAYELTVEFADATERFEQQAERTDAEGVLKEFIPVSSTKATVKLLATGNQIELKLGHLEPLDRDNAAVHRKGVQQRLTALGFYAGPIDGAESPELESALLGFQQFCSDRAAEGGATPDAGEPTGRLTPETLAALKNYYGC